MGTRKRVRKLLRAHTTQNPVSDNIISANFKNELFSLFQSCSFSSNSTRNSWGTWLRGPVDSRYREIAWTKVWLLLFFKIVIFKFHDIFIFFQNCPHQFSWQFHKFWLWRNAPTSRDSNTRSWTVSGARGWSRRSPVGAKWPVGTNMGLTSILSDVAL